MVGPCAGVGFPVLGHHRPPDQTSPPGNDPTDPNIIVRSDVYFGPSFVIPGQVPENPTGPTQNRANRSTHFGGHFAGVQALFLLFVRFIRHTPRAFRQETQKHQGRNHARRTGPDQSCTSLLEEVCATSRVFCQTAKPALSPKTRFSGSRHSIFSAIFSRQPVSIGDFESQKKVQSSYII